MPLRENTRAGTKSLYALGAPKEQKTEKESQFTLISPAAEQNIWGTGLKLTAKATPLSESQQGIYQIQFVIDGKKHPPSNQSTQEFENIHRGEHKIQALMIERDTGVAVRKSKTVTFYMHQNTKK